jgi:hypothetical protein
LDQTALYRTWIRPRINNVPAHEQVLTINRNIISVVNVNGQAFIFEVPTTGGWSAATNNHDRTQEQINNNLMDPDEYVSGFKVTGTTKANSFGAAISDQVEMSIYLHVDLESIWIFWGTGGIGGGAFNIVH